MSTPLAHDPASASADASVPLCVDLDGTLVALDTLHHTLKGMIISRPWLLVPAAFALSKGRSGFKHRVSQLFDIDPTALPYRQSVIEYIKTARQRGQRTVLATAATMRIARRVYEHLGIFDDLIASGEGVNRKGSGKLEAIRQRFGHAPFDYMGDSSADIPIFAASRRAILVHPSSSVREASGKRFQPYLIIE